MNNIALIEPWLVPYLPRSGDIALDVGANRGFWTADLAYRFRVVHAFEANPEVRRRYWTHDRVPDNVVLWPVAVGERVGRTDFYIYENDVHGSVYGDADSDLDTSDRGPSKRKIKVTMRNLDSFDLGVVDFVKIDVEGSEWAVLQGAKDILVHHRPTWLVEVHTERNARACWKVFADHHYDVSQIPHPHGPFPGHLWILAK